MTITPQELQSITKAYSLLYVEDEPHLRIETTKLFGHLFKSVETACDGQEGLDKYQAGNFDVVITDLSMPRMNGVAMVQAIKTIRPEQSVIIISAHDESIHLLPLIDAGVDKYILKPVSAKHLMDALYSVCMALHNEHLVKQYRSELERQNEVLIRNNDALKRLVRILDTKLRKNRTESTSATLPALSLPIESTQTLEKELSHLSHRLQTHPENFFATIPTTGSTLKHYGLLLVADVAFETLGRYFIQLGEALIDYTPLESTLEIETLFESFFYVFDKWQESLHKEGIEGAQMYDTSLINDIETLLRAITQTKSGY